MQTHNFIDSVPHEVFITESQDAYNRLRHLYLETFKPENQTEYDAVNHYAYSRWRLARCADLETQLVNESLRNIEKTFADDPTMEPIAPSSRTIIAFERCMEASAHFRRLPSYEAKLNRQLRDAEALLRRLLAKRETPDTPAQTQPIPANEGKIPSQTYRRPTPKVGRNEPCPCGSGLKWKRCCLNKPRRDVDKMPIAA